MKEDDFRAALRRAAQEEEQAFEAWRSSEEGRALEAPRTALVESIVSRALESVTRAGGDASRGLGIGVPAPGRAEATRRRVPATVALVALVFAAAAGLFLLVRRNQPSPVPDYAVAFVSGTEAHLRGEQEGLEPVTVQPSTQFELTLRPSTRLHGRVAVRAFLLTRTNRVPLSIDSAFNEAGVARVRGTWPSAGVLRGARELVLVVGRPEELPAEVNLDPSPSAALRIVRVALKPDPD